MKSKVLTLVLSIALLFVLCSASLVRYENSELEGYWVRTNDHLQMHVLVQDESVLYSFIIQEGREKFPCDIKELPIYKNILKAGKNLWTCDFLVVTMGSCSTHYDEGLIRINKNGEMEINCPGFEKKI